MTEKADENIQRMILDIERENSAMRALTGRKAIDQRVIEAMRAVPRSQFVPIKYRDAACDNRALSIGHGQTISQPFIVALMTDLLHTDENATILEVGTGSGYQAAILSRLVRQVYSMEIIEELVQCARDRLQSLGFDNVTVKTGSGYEGWAEHAPFDGIIVTAAAPYIPSALIEQLKPGARLVIPVGQQYYAQKLLVVEKQADGSTTSRDILDVVFVPLVHGQDH